MGVAQDIAAEILPGASANPLGLLGLSAEILSLGMSEAELLTICRKFAKILIGQVHSDVTATTARNEYLSRRFSEALMALRDEEQFHTAFIQLRQHVSRMQNEVNLARREAAQAFQRARTAEINSEKDALSTSVAVRKIGNVLTKASLDVAAARRDAHLERIRAGAAEETVYERVKKRNEREWDSRRKALDKVRRAQWKLDRLISERSSRISKLIGLCTRYRTLMRNEKWSRLWVTDRGECS